MKTPFRSILYVTLLGLLLAAAALLAAGPAQAAQPANDGAPAEGIQAVTDSITVTVLTLNISNEAPFYLIDSLIAQGHGDDTLFEVLGYLKAQSGAVISDAFYNDVANLPAGSEVFSAHLSNYAGLGKLSLEIAADGSVHLRNLKGSAYAEMPGYGTAFSQDRRFSLTYAQDAENYIYTGTDFSYPPGGAGDIDQYDYYTFAIAWDDGEIVYLPMTLRRPYANFADDFSDPGSGWTTGSGSGWSVGYLNGEYQILLTENDHYAFGSPSLPAPANHRLEVEARLVTANNGSYGLAFSGDEQAGTGYAFTVTPATQSFALTRHNADNTWTVLEDGSGKVVIHAGTATNRLRIDRIGASMHAYVNNVLVAVWEDDSYLGGGLTYALTAASDDEKPVDVRFDNFSAIRTHLANPLYVDDFSATGRWWEADTGWGQFSYQSGEYEILLRNTNSWGFANAPIEGGLPRYAVEVDARVSAGTLIVYAINFGQLDGEHFYHFQIQPDVQQYALYKYENSTWTPLILETFNAAIHDETGVNHLRVERDGDLIRLYVNGTLLDSISDSSYLIDQEASLCSISGSEANVAARFDNFTFSELP